MIYVSYRLLSVFFPGLVSSCLLSWPCLLLSSFLALSPIPGLVSPYSLRILPVFLALSPIPGLVSPYSFRIPGLVVQRIPFQVVDIIVFLYDIGTHVVDFQICTVERDCQLISWIGPLLARGFCKTPQNGWLKSPDGLLKLLSHLVVTS